MSSGNSLISSAVSLACFLCVNAGGRFVFAETARATSAPAASRPASQMTEAYGRSQQGGAQDAAPSVGWYNSGNVGRGSGAGANAGVPAGWGAPVQSPVQAQPPRGYYGPSAAAGAAAQGPSQNAWYTGPVPADRQGNIGWVTGQAMPNDGQQGTHWTPPPGTRFGFQGGYGSSSVPYRGGYPPQSALPPGPADGARNDLWFPAAGSFFPGYLNKDGTVDRLDTRTGQYFFGIRNNQGSQDLFDPRRGQWYTGFRNPDGSIDYMSPNGRWMWSGGGTRTSP